MSHFNLDFKTADRTGFWSIISVGTRLALRCIHPQIHAADLCRCGQGQRWILRRYVVRDTAEPRGSETEVNW